MTIKRWTLGLLLVPLIAGGCVTRADLVERDRQIIRFMREQRERLDAVQREVERLRGDIEGGGGRTTSSGSGLMEDRLSALEAQAYGEQATDDALGAGGDPASTMVIDDAMVDDGLAQPPRTGLTGSWEADVSAERAASATAGGPEREEYLEILGMLERRDCGPAVAKLDDFARRHRGSPLADDALYWAARCYVLMGEATPSQATDYYNQAISKFYDVGTSYPNGEKTPMSLWEQGNLFIQLGDAPDARIVFARLIRDYPSSPEASKARQKLTELEQ